MCRKIDGLDRTGECNVAIGKIEGCLYARQMALWKQPLRVLYALVLETGDEVFGKVLEDVSLVQEAARRPHASNRKSHLAQRHYVNRKCRYEDIIGGNLPSVVSNSRIAFRTKNARRILIESPTTLIMGMLES
jgi:hypothetical protein